MTSSSLGKLSFIKNLSKSWVFLIAILAISAAFLFSYTGAKAENISINTAQNCDANAVMWCGASSVNDLIGKYNNGDGHNSAASIQHIYSYFGISSSEINSMNSSSVEVVQGEVNKDGNVYGINGKLIATNAITGGRQNIAGSTAVSEDGTPFFVRPPSVSFQANALYAYIVMSNNQFQFAIIASCGNAVKATPVAPAPTPTPKPTPTPTPPAPTSTTTTTSTPAATVTKCSGNTTNTAVSSTASQGGNCSTNTTIVQTQTSSTPLAQAVATTTPASTVVAAQTPTPAPAATPTSLVNTGPGDMVGIFVAVSSISAIGHQLFIRKLKNS